MYPFDFDDCPTPQNEFTYFKQLILDTEMMQFLVLHIKRMKKISKFARWVLYSVLLGAIFSPQTYSVWLLLVPILAIDFCNSGIKTYNNKAEEIKERS